MPAPSYGMPATTMMTSLTATALMTTMLVVTSSHAYRSGAPRVSCSSMFPRHGSNPQTSVPPYTLTLSTNVYSPGSRQTSPIKVTLKGRGGTPFRGILVEARSVDRCNDTVGKFTLDPRSEHLLQLLSCQHQHDSVTHLDNTEKTAVAFSWTPPESGKGHVYFRATVVKTASNFWNTASSPIVFQEGSDDAFDTTIVTCTVPLTLETALAIDGAPDNKQKAPNPDNGGLSLISCSYVILCSYLLTLCL